MPAEFERVVSVLSTATPTYTLATEVLSGAAIAVSVSDPAVIVHLYGIITVTTGVGATTFAPRLRRNGLAGTVVGAQTAITVPASSTVQVIIAADDAPGDVASLPYVLTGTAAGVAGAGVNAYLLALIG